MAKNGSRSFGNVWNEAFQLVAFGLTSGGEFVLELSSGPVDEFLKGRLGEAGVVRRHLGDNAAGHHGSVASRRRLRLRVVVARAVVHGGR
jgi:hypothetical protein